MIALIIVALIVVGLCVGWRSETRAANNLRPWAQKAVLIFWIAVAILATTFIFSSRSSGQSAEWIAHRTGESVALVKHQLAAGQRWDNTPPAGWIIPSLKHSPRHWIYYADTEYFHVVDQNGEIHTFVSYTARYDRATDTTQRQLENGRWVEF